MEFGHLLLNPDLVCIARPTHEPEAGGCFHRRYLTRNVTLLTFRFRVANESGTNAAVPRDLNGRCGDKFSGLSFSAAENFG